MGCRNVAGDESVCYSGRVELCLHHARQAICTFAVFNQVFDANGQIILGGGQDAMAVTTTGSRQGKFEALFWHKLFEEEVGRVKGHL